MLGMKYLEYREATKLIESYGFDLVIRNKQELWAVESIRKYLAMPPGTPGRKTLAQIKQEAVSVGMKHPSQSMIYVLNDNVEDVLQQKAGK